MFCLQSGVKLYTLARVDVSWLDPTPGKAAAMKRGPACAALSVWPVTQVHLPPIYRQKTLRLHKTIPKMWHVEIDGKERLFCDPEDAALGIRTWIDVALARGQLQRRPDGKRSNQGPAQPHIINGFTKVWLLQTSPQTHRPDVFMEQAPMTSAATNDLCSTSACALLVLW